MICRAGEPNQSNWRQLEAFGPCTALPACRATMNADVGHTQSSVPPGLASISLNLFTTHHALNVPMEVSHVATGFASAETETRCKLENLSRDVSLGAVLGKQLGSQRPGCAPLHSSKRSRSYACCGHCGIAVTAFQHEQLMADGQPAIEAMSCCCTQHSASRPGKPWQRGKRLHVVFSTAPEPGHASRKRRRLGTGIGLSDGGAMQGVDVVTRLRLGQLWPSCPAHRQP